MEEVNYCNAAADVRAIPGAAAALSRLRAAGWLAVIMTNQSGISRGRVTVEQYEAVQAEVIRQLGGAIDASYMSPDLPESNSPRRKPGTGMISEAVSDLGIDLGRSFFVGDKAIDIQCGHNAGLPAVLVRTGYGIAQAGCGADYEAGDVVEAIAWILECVDRTSLEV